MGVCPSSFEYGESPQLDKKTNCLYPSPLIDTKLMPSDKYDERFYFIKNEEQIDKTIEKLDDTVIMTEMKAAILDHTLADLENQNDKFKKITYVSDEEALRSQDPQRKNEEQSNGKIFSEEANKKAISTKRPNIPLNSVEFQTVSNKKPIAQGTLLIDIQKAQFLDSEFLEKNELSDPYILLRVYYTDKNKNDETIEATQFKTCPASSSLEPEWDELFEYNLDGQKKVSTYTFGISLFYKSKKERKNLQLGEEQLFSFSSLIDQRMQMKYIDFRNQDIKTVFARVRVRIQFLYDLELVKEKLAREIKAKIERLSRIREKHPVFQNQKIDRPRQKNSPRPSLSKKSSLSQSSNHENEDSEYFVA